MRLRGASVYGLRMRAYPLSSPPGVISLAGGTLCRTVALLGAAFPPTAFPRAELPGAAFREAVVSWVVLRRLWGRSEAVAWACLPGVQ